MGVQKMSNNNKKVVFVSNILVSFPFNSTSHSSIKHLSSYSVDYHSYIKKEKEKGDER